MLLHRAGREYVYVGVHALPSSPAAPEILLADAWHTGEWWAETTDRVWIEVAADLGVSVADVVAGSAGVARFLVAGPDATGNPLATIVVPEGTHDPLVRIVDNPETIVRDVGQLVVKG